MNLDNVLPIPLDYTEYVKTAMDLILSSEVSRKQLLKQAQNVCIVYSCLGVKPNGGVKNTAEKYSKVYRAFRETAAAAAGQRIDEEAAARNRKTARIADLKGQLELLSNDSPQFLAVRAAILSLYQTPDSVFMQGGLSVATSSTPAAAGYPSPGAAAPPPSLPGFAGGGASGTGAAGGGGFGGGVSTAVFVRVDAVCV